MLEDLVSDQSTRGGMLRNDGEDEQNEIQPEVRKT